ncbi:glycosyl transferase family 2 [Fibrella aestuarina BUZ 2]|uniref:Glycosyl transferase family 2 n=1 Tax=Fibrella aestuarina BUZ 2 TaxID=1166018 RepID=I0KFE4_9BACT|nr:glycosyltransferase family 2 protein [Fibrella aestuarina]CCH02847.1 glycosyl transferase family 2 [Fibrella aestuarina BUZ 2]
MNVSIITVVYNGADTIAEAIDSVLAQTYPAIEYIVVDGGSTDGTQAIVAGYGDRISRFVSEPDEGLYDAMNKGVRMATGDVIGILNADDLYRHPDVISRVVETFAQSGADAVYADLVYADRTNPDRVTRYWQAGDYTPGAFLRGWMPPHPTFFVRATVYRQYGYFSTELRSAADYELMLRLIHKHQIRVAYLKEVTVVMRMGGVSNSSLQNRIRANREDRLAWQLNQLKPSWFTLWLKPLRKIGQFYRSISPTS